MREIDRKELLVWLACEEIDPILGGWRDDWRIARLTSMYANCHRDPEKRPEPFELTDFMLDFGEPPPPPEPQSEEQQMAVVRLTRLFAPAFK